MAWKPSSLCQYSVPGMISARAPTPTKKKFIAKPVHISSLIFLYPHTSHTQSLMMYDTGKMMKPPVSDIPNTLICFVSSTFAAIRQTQKSMLKSMNSTLTSFLGLFISLFFKRLPSTL